MDFTKLKLVVRKTAKRMPYITMLLSAAAILIHIYYSLRPHLIYTRTDVIGGDFWRLVSCHWVHLDADHLLWSSMTFLLLGSFCEILHRAKFVMTVSLSAIFIPIVIWIVMPHLEVYGGLSGLDCALYSLLVALFIKREWNNRNWTWIIFYGIMLVLLPAKVIYELISGLTIFVNSSHTSMVPVPLAHLVGGIVGFVVGMDRLRVRTMNYRAAPNGGITASLGQATGYQSVNYNRPKGRGI